MQRRRRGGRSRRRRWGVPAFAQSMGVGWHAPPPHIPHVAVWSGCGGVWAGGRPRPRCVGPHSETLTTCSTTRTNPTRTTTPPRRPQPSVARQGPAVGPPKSPDPHARSRWLPLPRRGHPRRPTPHCRAATPATQQNRPLSQRPGNSRPALRPLRPRHVGGTPPRSPAVRNARGWRALWLSTI